MESSKGNKTEPKPIVIKNCAGLQRMKLEKLMKNPDKPVIIPERLKEKKLPHVPEFVRNVMGSSAGAGSGEFHVYRHLRRKEYSRQKYIQEKSEKVMLDEAYQQRVLDNKHVAEERTAKKRAKRLKKKAKKIKRDKSKTQQEQNNGSALDNEDESEDEENSEANEN